MADLAERIDRFVRENGCTGITVWFTEGRWQANFQMADKKSWRIMFGDTPAEALHKASYSAEDFTAKKPKRRERDNEDLI